MLQAMISANATAGFAADVVYAFSDGCNQARDFAKKSRAHFGECEVHRFPDGETLVTVTPPASLSGRAVAIYRSLHDPNAKLVELMLAARTLRSLGAEKLVLIAPYLPYMRQDRAFRPGQAVSQAVIGTFLADLFDGIVTVQPHLHRTRSLSAVFGGKPALDLSAGHAIAAHMRDVACLSYAVVGPDEESEGLIRNIADALGIKGFTASKQRHGDREVTIELPRGLELRGRPVTIVDDIISSGSTVATLAKALKRAGAGDITVHVVHALFEHRAALMMAEAGVSKIVSLDTVPHPTNAIAVVDVICTGLGVRA